MKVPAIKRMQECNVCRIDKKTWEMTEEEVEKLVSEVESLSKVKSHSIELPSVVPMVSLKDPASYHFDTIDVGAIVVMFEDLFDRGLKTYYRTIKRGSGYLYLKNLRHF